MKLPKRKSNRLKNYDYNQKGAYFITICVMERQELLGKIAVVPSVISTFKRFTNKECGISIFQRSYHDYIIRNQLEYEKISEYIETNPLKWEEDKYYSKVK